MEVERVPVDNSRRASHEMHCNMPALLSCGLNDHSTKGTVPKKTYLRDEREARAQIEQRHGSDVDAVDEDAAAGRLHHALERHHERALAAAGAPRDPDLLPPCESSGIAWSEVMTWDGHDRLGQVEADRRSIH